MSSSLKHSIGSAILLILLQAFFGYVAFFCVYFNGFDTYIPSMFHFGVVVFIISILLPWPFWYSAWKKEQPVSPLIINLLASIFLLILLLKAF